MKKLAVLFSMILLPGNVLFSQVAVKTDEKIVYSPGGVKSGACGSSITINHVEGTVSPVNKTVTYGTVTNIPGETSKCWITSNLGADHQATTVDDATEPSAGWYWQFNRMQGYKHTGTLRTPNSAWIYPIDELLNWEPANDPCSLVFGAGWRIPTYTEWTNVDASGSWTNWNGPWISGLKLHAAGYLFSQSTNGQLYDRGSFAFYWSSTMAMEAGHAGWHLGFYSSASQMTWNNKANGFTLRCLIAPPTPPANTTVTGTVTGSVCYNATQTITVAGEETTFTILSGGSATMISGQTIRYLRGTSVVSGGYMLGYIAPTGPFCMTPSMPAVIKSQEAPSAGIEKSFFKIYPNPTTDVVIVELPENDHAKEATITVYNIQGGVILQKTLNGESKFQFSLSGKPSGIYMVHVRSAEQSEVVNVVKN